MGAIKDLQAIGLLLVLQLGGFLAWVLSALPPVLAILPIPHTPHEWGLAFSTCFVYLLRRRSDRKRIRRRAPTHFELPADRPAAPARRKPSKKENAKHPLRKVAKP